MLIAPARPVGACRVAQLSSNPGHPVGTAVERVWSVEDDAAPESLAVISEGVLSHGRRQAKGGNPRPVHCLVREAGQVIAGGIGRTEFDRLFVSHLWVEERLRGQGLGSLVLRELEREASRRGCSDAIIETLDDRVAALYARLGYKAVAVIPGYVGRFTRHIMVKPRLAAPVGEA